MLIACVREKCKISVKKIRRNEKKNLHRRKYVNSLNRDCENFLDKRKPESSSKRECKELYLNHKT